MLRRAHPILTRLKGRATLDDRLAELDHIRDEWRLRFAERGIEYPPSRLIFLGLKQERVLEVYAQSIGGGYQMISRYPVLGASGDLGPKLREGDRQVPEGIYNVFSLNPNSRFHLSIELDYPNAFDREVAAQEGRTRLGGDIFIHGGSESIGCLAIGDPAIEELFVLVADAGIERVEVFLAPLDLRSLELPDDLRGPWQYRLYEALAERMAEIANVQ
jgi:hypothetical protein